MRTFIAFLALAATASAQSVVSPGGRVRIARHEVDVEIDQQVARTTVTQVFRSTADAVREATYLFHLPPGTAPTEFRMWIGDRVMDGEMLERERAESVYQRFVRKSIDPGILDHVKDDLWRVRIFPVPPAGAALKFQTRYHEVLPEAGGTITYRYPLLVSETEALQLEDFSIRVRARALRPVHHLEAGGLSVAWKSPEEFSAEADRKAVSFGQDLVLRFRTGNGESDARLAAHRSGEDDGYFILYFSPGTQDLRKVPEREVLFLLDASSSIDPEALRAASGGIADSLARLGPGDRFNILAFGRETLKFRERSVPFSEEESREAGKFMAALKPAGRTNLSDALARALEASPDRFRLVVLVSDGTPTAGEASGAAIAEAVAAKTHDRTVLCALRIGDSEGQVLETLARRTGGECAAAGPVQAGRFVPEMLRRFTPPALTNVKVDFGGADVYATHTRRHGGLASGDTLMVTGRYRKPGDHDVTLTGRNGEREVRFTRKIHFPESDRRWDGTPRVWAIHQIASLLARHPEVDERAGIVDLSKKHLVVTPFTAFLVLEEDRMYADFGLPRTRARQEGISLPMKPRPIPFVDGMSSLPPPPVQVVDLFKDAPGEKPFVAALRWLSTHAQEPEPLKDGRRGLDAAGVDALLLMALGAGRAYALDDPDRSQLDAALKTTLERLLKGQTPNGSFSLSLYDHSLATLALARLAAAQRLEAGTKDALQRAVSCLCDSPSPSDDPAVAALVLVALLEARALGIEADAETIHSARAKAVPGPTGFYVLARRRDDPASVRDPRIAAFSAALRRAGPSDPLEGWIACEALAGTWDAATADSKRWHGILAKHGRSSTRDGSWLPRGWQGGSRHAATALLVLLMDSWDRGNRP